MTKRREFIKKSMMGTAGIAIGGIGFSSKSYASIIAANEHINVAVIGIRNQGGRKYGNRIQHPPGCNACFPCMLREV
jgi:polysaccharide deacetylase 2 family uncharacterized protein YibQ